MIDSFLEKSESYEKIIKACKHILHNEQIATDAKKYLDSRISSFAQERYDFGYFPKNSELSCLFDYISEAELEGLGLLKKRHINYKLTGFSHFDNHNLVMPFKNSEGNVTSIVGRSLLSDDERKELKIDKYKYTRGSKKKIQLYGFNYARDAIIEKNFVICVEGQFDCIALQEVGLDNSVALGWATLSLFQLCQLLRYTKNIILLLDNDDAGQKGVNKILSKYGSYDINFIIKRCPEGYKDIDEFLKKENPATTDIYLSNLQEKYGQT